MYEIEKEREINNGSKYIIGNPQITFMKNAYKRHTELLSRKTICQTENNRYIFSTNEDIEIIDKIFIGNIDNVKCIGLYIISTDIDSNTINTDTQDDIQINPENSTICCIFRMNQVALQTYIKLNGNNLINNQVYELFNISKHALIPKFLKKSNKKLLLIVDSFNLVDKQFNLTIKYKIVNNFDEIRKFNLVDHEYCIRKSKSFEYNIVKGENIIGVEFLRNLIIYIVINIKNVSDIPITRPIDIEYKTFGSKREDKIIKRKLFPTNLDLEFAYITIPNHTTYILDSYENIGCDNEQLKGIFEMRESSHFKFTSEYDTKITITYCVFDVIQYGRNELKMLYMQTEPEIIE